MTSDEQFAFDLQVFQGQLLNIMDEYLAEWEARERLKACGLPPQFGKCITNEWEF